MEEPNATTEASPLRDVSADVRSCVHDCSCGSNRETSLSMPVCFLVREQAKSQVAIQDLQRRLNHVEIVQDDVVDAIIEFRNYLSDTKSFSNANHLTSSFSVTRSPSNVFATLTPGSKLSGCNVPSASEPSVEVPTSILKTRTYSSKDCDYVCNELGRLPAISASHEHSQKHFDLIKSKDSVLESDKQDSGLDSDCREHNDIHPSLNKNVSNALDPESNDELLQLLDEISHRSAILQKQLAVTEEASAADESKAMSSMCQSEAERKDNKDKNHVKSKFELSDNRLGPSKNPSTLNVTSVGNGGLCAEQKVPPSVMENSSGRVGLLEMKPVSSRVSARKRITNSIDSSTVSAILKETNVVDLQRQALIYLVDNAVLHTKLKELDQKLSSQQVESEKLENSLKEEARLLMMENRELRISLDEQKMESSGMKSRLVMLERVLQSVTHENQELNWQLGESLNLQNLSKRGLQNYSSSYGCENPTSSFKLPRRSSMPSRFYQSDASCVKSKLLSNPNSYLDIPMEESEEIQPHPTGSSAFKCRNGPIYSSTPMMSFQKQKTHRAGLNNFFSPIDASPANFHSVKKYFKPNHSQDASSRIQKSDRYREESHHRNDQASNFPRSNVAEEALPLENVGKFPFNTILEKLKSNSEYRLSKSASAKSSATSDSQTSTSSNKTKAAPLLENESASHPKDSNSLQGSSSDVLQRKKGGNIQQRIQNILDRIVAESEEAS